MQEGSTAELHTCSVASVAQLQLEHGPYSSTVVAAGAAAGALPEIGDGSCRPLSHTLYRQLLQSVSAACDSNASLLYKEAALPGLKSSGL